MTKEDVIGLPQKRPTDAIKDVEIRQQIEDIQEDATGRVIELSAAPTATVPLLQDGERGTYGGILYSRVANNVFAFTPSSTTVVT